MSGAAPAAPAGARQADELPPPEVFPFPFPPYNVQKDFMRQLWQTVERGHLGVFESPTGTGKSMSMICSSLAWLRANEVRDVSAPAAGAAGGAGAAAAPAAKSAGAAGAAAPAVAAAAEADADDDEPAWVKEHAVKAAAEAAERAKRERAEQREKFARIREEDRRRWEQRKAKRQRRTGPDGGAGQARGGGADAAAGQAQDAGGADQSDDEFLVADYFSDGAGDDSESSSDDDEAGRGGAAGEDRVTKILFCSRTHSQLSQFMHEVRASPFGEDVRAVVLGSRQTLCVNEKVSSLSSLARMNDKCKDLQQKKGATGKDGKKATGCQYLDAKRVRFFADRTLAHVQDVEELKGLGSRTEACPYYGTRAAVADAEVVAMPYNLLLHKSTREAVGIELEGNIVLIDEAHNLLPAIEAIHSHAVTGAILQRAHGQLLEYRTRYGTRMNTRNVVYVDQILSVLSGFLSYAKQFVAPAGRSGRGAPAATVVAVNDFLFKTYVDNMNLFKLARYFEKSEISNRVNGFVLKREGDAPPVVAGGRGSAAASAADVEYVPKHVSALKTAESFFLSLTNADRDGRLVIQPAAMLSGVTIKFLLLNPSVYFAEVLRKSRAVILAGGTMSPMSQFAEELCGNVAGGGGGSSVKGIDFFSCGHVIPPKNLAAAIVRNGPSGSPLRFTYQNRKDPAAADRLLRDAGQLVLNLCNVVPDGVVVFFPSYDYEQLAHDHWERTGILAKIRARKRVFREPRSGSSSGSSGGGGSQAAPVVDNVLSDYARCIERDNAGALLLSVVGGKMSEGINFKDRLGRCVVVMGLPFPNVNSPELREKMAFLDKAAAAASKGGGGGGGGGVGASRGDEFYVNICMKAVNQSIGRAIRHRGDYATIVLADARYAEDRIARKLSSWIHASVRTYDRFGPVIADWRRFYRGHAEKELPA